MNVYELYQAGRISTRIYNALCKGIKVRNDESKFMTYVEDDYCYRVTCTIEDLFEQYGEQGLLGFRYMGPKAIEELNIAIGNVPKPKDNSNERPKNSPMTPAEFAAEMSKICNDHSRDPEEAFENCLKAMSEEPPETEIVPTTIYIVHACDRWNETQSILGCYYDKEKAIDALTKTHKDLIFDERFDEWNFPDPRDYRYFCITVEDLY